MEDVLAGSSIAVWCTAKPETKNSFAEIHYNYWRICGDRDFKGRPGKPPRDFSEIGVWLSNPLNVNEIKIYIPDFITKKDIEDCARRLESVSIAQGIFNEPLACETSGTHLATNLDLKIGSKSYCRVQRFLYDSKREIEETQLSVTQEAEGSLLTIKKHAIETSCDKIDSDCPLYFRLRFYVKPKTTPSFVNIVKPKDRLLQSGFAEIEYMDFRLNDARALPPMIETQMRGSSSGPQVLLNKVAFLATFPVDADITASSKQSHKNRLLEHDLWDPYVPSGIPTAMVVYHWRSFADENMPQGIENFSAFVKLQTRRSGRAILIVYLVVAFILAIFGNLAASCLVAEFTRHQAGDANSCQSCSRCSETIALG